MNGAPLPPQHGWPLRLVVPGRYGMALVKWLREIRVVDAPFTGFQQSVVRLGAGTRVEVARGRRVRPAGGRTGDRRWAWRRRRCA
ncbi:molybdopterin-dependent oxidoreductase [Streptomyces sp. NPDC002784]